jgi:hypothetical protein
MDDGEDGAVKTNGRAVVQTQGTESGVTNDDGTFTPAEDLGEERWSGRGMLLDEGPEQVVAGGGTRVEYDADAVLWLPKGTVARAEIVDGDAVAFTYDNGDEVSASVKKAVRFKDCLYLRRA